jgi:WD40 repeat protein
MGGMRLRSRIVFCSLSLFLFIMRTGSAENAPIPPFAGTKIDPIACQAYDPQSASLILGGEDGFITRLDLLSFLPIMRFQSSSGKIRQVAVSPGNADIAAIESDALNVTRLVVWDRKGMTRKYAIPISDRSLFLAYSPKGSYLILGIEGIEGLKIVEAESGLPLAAIRDSGGPVSWAAAGSTERSVLAYRPSGQFVFLNLLDGKTIASVQAPKGLDSLTMLPDKRSIACRENNDLIIMDSQTGEIKTRAGLEDVAAICSSDNGVALSRADGSFSYIELASSSIEKITIGLSPIPIASLIQLKTDSVVGFSIIEKDGSIAFLDESLLFSRRYAVMGIPPTSAARSIEGSMRIASGKFVFDLPLSSLSAVNAVQVPLERLFFPEALPGSLSFLTIDRYRSLYWYERSDGTVECLLSNLNPSPKVKSIRFESSIISAEPGTGGIFIVEKSGKLSLLDLDKGESLPIGFFGGLQTASGFSGDFLLLGKNRTGNFLNALSLVSLSTGETVPLQDPSYSVFRIETDLSSGPAFFLSIEEEGGRRSTSIKALDIDLVMPGEKEQGTSILTNLGEEGLLLVKPDGREIRFERSVSLPLYVSSGGDTLSSVNYDGTITLYDMALGSVLCILRPQAEGVSFYSIGRREVGYIPFAPGKLIMPEN